MKTKWDPYQALKDEGFARVFPGLAEAVDQACGGGTPRDETSPAFRIMRAIFPRIGTGDNPVSGYGSSLTDEEFTAGTKTEITRHLLSINTLNISQGLRQ